MSLNPSSPTRLGLEWLPTLDMGLQVNEFQQADAHFTPSAAVTGDDVMVHLASLVGTPRIQADLVPRASAVPGTVTLTDYQPNGDDSQTGVLTHSAGGTSAPFYVDVDEVGTIDAAYLLLSSNSGGARFQLNTAAATGRIVSVTVTVTVEVIAGFTTGQIVPTIEVGGVVYAGDTVELTDLGAAAPSYTWDYNPATGGAWTLADIQALDGTDSAGFTYTSGITNTIRVQKVHASVATVTEARIAAGVFTAADGANTVSMLTPAGVDTWSLASGTEYLLMLSNPSGDGRAVWVTFDAADEHPAGIGSNVVTFDPDNHLPSEIGDDDTAVPVFAVLTATGPSTADAAQVYSDLDEEAVYNGRTVEQEFTPPGAADYGHVAFVVRQQSDDTTADLTVQVGRRDTGVVLGTATVTTHDVRDAPLLPQLVAANLAALASLPASQCFVRWSSTAESGDGWLVTVLSTDETVTELLTANQQGIETNITGWAAESANTTVARTTSEHDVGVAAMAVTRTSGTATVTATTPTGLSGFPVVEGRQYHVRGRGKSAVNTRSLRLDVQWFDAAGANISTTSGSTVTSSTSAWKDVPLLTVTAPALAAFAALKFNALSAGSVGGEAHYGDTFSVLDLGSATFLGAAGYGAITDVATVDGTDDLTVDIPVLVSQVPATITGVNVASHTDANGFVAARITFNQTSLTTTFERYVIRRKRPDGTWQTVGHISTKATTTFDDYGWQSGEVEEWDVQVEDTNGLTSIPSASDTLTLTRARHQVVVNHDPDLNVELALAPGHEHTFGGAVEAYDVAGSDAARVLWGDETADRTAYVAQLFSSTLLGPNQFAALRAIVDAQRAGDVPHVTLVDPWGNRTEVAFIVPSGTVVRGTRANAPVQVVDVGEPVPVEVP